MNNRMRGENVINKRLISLLGKSKRYIYLNVACEFAKLLCNVVVTCLIALMISDFITGSFGNILPIILAALAAVVIRHFVTVKAADMSFMASGKVKQTLRTLIYDKLTRLGASYHEKVPTAEAVQLMSDGVEQLETYYSAFLPQFLYSMLAPVALFAFMAFIHLPTAIVLLVMVPLIPGAIMAAQKVAKKILSKYWVQYATLSDSFLENLQGLTTLKIYQADGYKAKEMAAQSEHFRKITMKVLTMQLNSITIMDIVAYGGAAAGLILSLSAYSSGAVSFWGSFVMIVLAAEFFLPLRALGSYFHTAMNGIAASDKMFSVLDLDEPPEKSGRVGSSKTFETQSLDFSYDGNRMVLENISFKASQGEFVAIVGESGSGKSTLASILTGQATGYTGSAKLGESEIHAISNSVLTKTVTYIGHNSYVFKGTVGENLRLAKPDATDEQLWSVLEQVQISQFFQTGQGLDTILDEGGSNLSGGQRQRLALARAFLHDTPVYIFDEATSNIDAQSEEAISCAIGNLSVSKTIIIITHRLLNAACADNIYVLDNGLIAGSGKHEELLENCPCYRQLWDKQQELENFEEAQAWHAVV